MTDREKLIILLLTLDNCSYNCEECEYENEVFCQTVRQAEHLIKNGVTLTEKGKWLDGHCTNCGSRELGLFDAKNYCPNCGAKMDGENK